MKKTETAKKARAESPKPKDEAAHKREPEAGVEARAETQAEVNLGLIGHVDHGKTSLTKALTGKWTDTHSEELKKGISIRLGYADAVFRKCEKCKGSEAYATQATCGVCGGKTKVLRKVSFIDAPGHETLMTTMLSGAALMHGAILVIAANEFVPQPRTAEHLMALSVSGTKNVVVAQNKIDLVDKEKALENQAQIRKFLKEFGYENAPIIPTAAHFNTNIDLLIEAIEEHIPSPKFDEKLDLKMYAARSFDVNKPGISPEEMKGGVLGGSIVQGTVKKGDSIEISPGINGKSIVTKVIEIDVANGLLESARPGGLIALGTNLDPGLTRSDQMRGQVIAKPGTLPAPVNSVKLDVHLLQRLVGEKTTDILPNELLVITVGTMTMVGNVAKKHKNLVELALKMPIVVEKGQKVAISKMEQQRWRLVAYGVAQ
ncbi:MAG TPA: translation initiation factor IF-2 subunit gamma [Candidatus Diapherotrites archaeon]|uniref:protein-synthesizing GTPase n=1 Tax=Candidatus Iainarchaeum sp. TaxID=3101447 RepID=A0A7J4JFZ1_9ARCH|nr:translation initiation factor IF-2 subunit gamma [Candidatus Diapherotrites archaeon]HIH16234.1 translation initiation factor IF-2 subunit gamma [Candidatus Diapherotrites archaeon]